MGVVPQKPPPKFSGQVVDCQPGKNSFGEAMTMMAEAMQKFGLTLGPPRAEWTCVYCKAACSGSKCLNCGAPMPGGGR